MNTNGEHIIKIIF